MTLTDCAYCERAEGIKQKVKCGACKKSKTEKVCGGCRDAIAAQDYCANKNKDWFYGVGAAEE